MNEKDFSRAILRDLAAQPVSGKAEKRLAAAREAALAAAHYQSQGALAIAGHRVMSFWRGHHGLALAVLVVVSVLALGWMQHVRKVQSDEITLTTQLLADELPLEVFLSDEFDSGGRP